MLTRFKFTTLAAFLWFLSALSLCAQVPVILAPLPQLQFFTQSGVPLAFGCVFTYQSQTSTPLGTYTDFTGTILNPNPVVLSAGGSANIWLQAGQAYTLIIKSSGGSNCSTGTTQYTVNGIGGGTSQQTTTVTPVAGSATFTVQSQNQLFEITLTSNVTGQPLSAVGIIPPSLVTFQITQDGVGNHTFSWPANSVGGASIGLSANQVTTQTFIWNGTSAYAIGPGMEGNGPLVAIGSLILSNSITAPAFISNSANPALSGIFRMASGDGVAWRNNANGADLLLTKNSSDNLVWANGLSLGGGTALPTTNQSGSGSICMTTGCALSSPTMTTPSLGVATATSLACAVVSKTGNYSLTTSDCFVLANATGGAFTLTLPHAANGQIWTIVRTDSSANKLTIVGDSGNVNGQTSQTVSGSTPVSCTSDGTNLWCTGGLSGPTQWTTVGSGCTANGSPCTVSGTWPQSFSDSTYTMVCMPTSEASNSSASFWVSAQTASGFTISIDNRGMSNPGGYGGFYCTAHHL